MKLMKKKRYALVFGLLGLWAFIILKIDFNLFSIELLKQHAAHLHEYTQDHYNDVLIHYLFFFIGATAAFIPVTILMTILGGFLFGSLYGALYAAFAATIGGTIVFLIVRHLMRKWVRARYANRFERFNKRFQTHGAWYLLCLQISPITPTFFINLLVGLTNISLWTYMWTAFVGMLPGAFIYALAGQKLQIIGTVKDIMPPLIFLILFIISLFGLWPMMSKRLKQWNQD